MRLTETDRDGHLEPVAPHQVLRELLGLLGPDRPDLPPCTLNLLLLGARGLCAAGCHLFLLAHAQLGEKLPAARDERFAEGEGAAFGVGSCDELGELRRLVCSLFLGDEHRRGVDHAHGIVERRHERAQATADELGRRGLDGGVARRGGARSCGAGLVGGKGLVDE